MTCMRARPAWQKAADHLQQWEPGKDLLGSATLLKKAFSGLSRLESGDWTFQFYRRDFQPGAAFQQSLGALLRHCLAAELTGCWSGRVGCLPCCANTTTAMTD